jgi:predicted AlkP superfamily phosphohydrolase/phosphomutase
MAMMTSQDPGMLGVYGFRNRASHVYEDTFTVNSTHVQAKTIWNILSRNRLRSIVMGVPLTYPPKPLNVISFPFGPGGSEFIVCSSTVPCRYRVRYQE